MARSALACPVNLTVSFRLRAGCASRTSSVTVQGPGPQFRKGQEMAAAASWTEIRSPIMITLSPSCGPIVQCQFLMQCEEFVDLAVLVRGLQLDGPGLLPRLQQLRTLLAEHSLLRFAAQSEEPLMAPLLRIILAQHSHQSQGQLHRRDIAQCCNDIMGLVIRYCEIDKLFLRTLCLALEQERKRSEPSEDKVLTCLNLLKLVFEQQKVLAGELTSAFYFLGKGQVAFEKVGWDASKGMTLALWLVHDYNQGREKRQQVLLDFRGSGEGSLMQLVVQDQKLFLVSFTEKRKGQTFLCNLLLQRLQSLVVQIHHKREFLRWKHSVSVFLKEQKIENIQVVLPLFPDKVAVVLGPSFTGRIGSVLLLNSICGAAVEQLYAEAGFVNESSLQNLPQLLQHDFQNIAILLSPIRTAIRDHQRYAVQVKSGTEGAILGDCGVHVNDCYKKYIQYYGGIDYLLPFFDVIGLCKPDRCPYLLDSFLQVLTLLFSNKPECQQLAADQGFFLALASRCDRRVLPFFSERTFFLLSSLSRAFHSKRLKNKLLTDFLLLLEVQFLDQHLQLAFLNLLERLFGEHQRYSKNAHRQLFSYLLLHQLSPTAIWRVFELLDSLFTKKAELYEQLTRLLSFSSGVLLQTALKYAKFLCSNNDFPTIFYEKDFFLSLYLLSSQQKLQALLFFIALCKRRSLFQKHPEMYLQAASCLVDSSSMPSSVSALFNGLADQVCQGGKLNIEAIQILTWSFTELSPELKLLAAQRTFAPLAKDWTEEMLKVEWILGWLARNVGCVQGYEVRLLECLSSLIFCAILTEYQGCQRIMDVLALSSSPMGTVMLAKQLICKFQNLRQASGLSSYLRNVVSLLHKYLCWCALISRQAQSSDLNMVAQSLRDVFLFFGVCQVEGEICRDNESLQMLLFSVEGVTVLQVLLKAVVALTDIGLQKGVGDLTRAGLQLQADLGVGLLRMAVGSRQYFEDKEEELDLVQQTVFIVLTSLQSGYGRLMFWVVDQKYQVLPSDQQIVLRRELELLKALAVEGLLQLLHQLHSMKYIRESWGYFTTILQQKVEQCEGLFHKMPHADSKDETISLLLKKRFSAAFETLSAESVKPADKAVKSLQQKLTVHRASANRVYEGKRRELTRVSRTVRQKLQLYTLQLSHSRSQISQLSDVVQNKIRQGRNTFIQVWVKEHSYTGFWQDQSFFQHAQNESSWDSVRPNSLFKWTRAPFTTGEGSRPFLVPNFLEVQRLFEHLPFSSRPLHLLQAIKRGKPSDQFGQFAQQKPGTGIKLFTKMLKKSNQNLSQEELIFQALLVKQLGAMPGYLLYYKHALKFVYAVTEVPREEQHKSIAKLKLRPSDPYTKTWRTSDLLRVARRRYLLQPIAVELFFNSGKSAFLALTEASVQTFLQLIKPLVKVPLPEKNQVQQKWLQSKITTLQYLNRLNDLSGRTYNDLSQYPVAPWVLQDYSARELDLEQLSLYRNLKENMGRCGDEGRRNRAAQQLKNKSQLQTGVKPYNHGFHYSNVGIVTQFLVRLQPFTQAAKCLQGGKFDVSDRLFYGICDSWSKASREVSDVRELIPEFYYLPQTFININCEDFGRRQDGKQVGDVQLPCWAKSPYDFVAKMRSALQSTHCSQTFAGWIDLIFGCKASGKEAEQASNVFYYLSYDQAATSLHQEEQADERRAKETQALFYGKTPSQLFGKPHPPRLLTREVRLHLQIFKQKLVFGEGTQDIGLVRKVEQEQAWALFTATGHMKFIRVEQKSITTFRYATLCSKGQQKFEMSLACDAHNTQTLLLGGQWNGIIRIQTLDKKTERTARKHLTTVVGVRSAGQRVVSASKDGHIVLWSIWEGQLTCLREVFQLTRVVGVEVSEALNVFFAIKADSVSMYSLDDCLLIRVFKVRQVTTVVALVRPLPCIAFVSNRLLLYSVNGQLLGSRPAPNSLACLLDPALREQFVVQFDKDSLTLAVLSVPDLKQVRVLRMRRENSEEVLSMASRESTICLVGRKGQVVFLLPS